MLTSTEEMQEAGTTVYRPYPRRLEPLTICGSLSKGRTFPSVIPAFTVAFYWSNFIFYFSQSHSFKQLSLPVKCVFKHFAFSGAWNTDRVSQSHRRQTNFFRQTHRDWREDSTKRRRGNGRSSYQVTRP